MTRKIISLFVALTMVCTMTSVSVFATENVTDEGDQSAGTDIQMTQGIDGAVQDPDEEMDESVPAETVEQPAMMDQGFTVQEGERLPTPTNVNALAGYKAVKITWNEVPEADAYNVGIRTGSGWSSVGMVRKGTTSIEKKGLETRTDYTFRVMAVKLKNPAGALNTGNIEGSFVNGSWTAPVSEPAYINNKNVVNRLRISFTMKKTKKAHGKKLKKGERVWAEDFGLGKYSVYRGGKRLRVPRVMVKKIKASYKGKGSWNYSDAEAKYFIQGYLKAKGVGSKTRYVIWVSTYTQHLYVFDKKDGYEVVKDHEICMGRKTAPSPTGNKVIQKKTSSRHGIRYWSCYSGWNALHGFKSSWKKSLLGKLASGGCVRNWNSDAKWIYKNCPKGTRVILY